MADQDLRGRLLYDPATGYVADDLGEEEDGVDETQGSVSRLLAVFSAFLPLGFIAFGGPSAHIGLLHKFFVEKRKWVDEARFLELLGVGQGIPGNYWKRKNKNNYIHFR